MSIMLFPLITYRNPGLPGGGDSGTSRDSVTRNVCESCPETMMIIMINPARVRHHRAAGHLDHAGRAKPTVPTRSVRRGVVYVVLHG